MSPHARSSWPAAPAGPRENLPVVLGTLVSQTLLNIAALAVLGAVMFSSVNLFSGHQNALLVAAIAPLALLVLVLLAPVVLRHGGSRLGRLQSVMTQIRGAMTRVRAGLAVFRQPRLGAVAALAQFAAWALQWLSCYFLLVALGLNHQAGMAAAAAVLFAVNITAVLPATPANLGVFQAACAAVLHTGWHVGIRHRGRVRGDPAVRRGRHRPADGRSGAGQGGHVLARGAPARDACRAGQAAGPAAVRDAVRDTTGRRTRSRGIAPR